jgi:glycerol-3-phosphate dehydrogenase (NAD(P)+)
MTDPQHQSLKIGYLGAGAWGFCLARLLALKGHQVTLWSKNSQLVDNLRAYNPHPHLPNARLCPGITLTTDLEEAVDNKDLLVESVTLAGLRPVFLEVAKIGIRRVPIILTSKGIEHNTMLLPSEILTELLGEEFLGLLASLSGPSLANPVALEHPTAVVCAAYRIELANRICSIFSNQYFRVYPNSDILGVSFGGAMKNIIAIAAGISDGLGFGENSKAALITRGLHEICKLAAVKGANPETLYGLAGLGDLCVTALSSQSRNYRFGQLIAKGHTTQEAKDLIGMVVEGAYSCLSALQLAHAHNVPIPITEVTHAIVYHGLPPREAVQRLMLRPIKEEHL